MQYFSTSRQVPATTFSHAVIEGLAADGGLFMPETIPALPESFFNRLPLLSLPEIGFEVARHFTGAEIGDADLRRICNDALDFEIPLIELDAHTHVLELFHGPTLAFKDVGARFMYFTSSSTQLIIFTLLRFISLIELTIFKFNP